MENKPCTKFCGVLINIHEVMELQNFEFDVNDVIHANERNIPLLLFCIFLLILWKQNALQSFLMFLSIFNEFMKSGSFE